MGWMYLRPGLLHIHIRFWFVSHWLEEALALAKSWETALQFERGSRACVCSYNFSSVLLRYHELLAVSFGFDAGGHIHAEHARFS